VCRVRPGLEGGVVGLAATVLRTVSPMSIDLAKACPVRGRYFGITAVDLMDQVCTYRR